MCSSVIVQLFSSFSQCDLCTQHLVRVARCEVPHQNINDTALSVNDVVWCKYRINPKYHCTDFLIIKHCYWRDSGVSSCLTWAGPSGLPVVPSVPMRSASPVERVMQAAAVVKATSDRCGMCVAIMFLPSGSWSNCLSVLISWVSGLLCAYFKVALDIQLCRWRTDFN